MINGNAGEYQAQNRTVYIFINKSRKHLIAAFLFFVIMYNINNNYMLKKLLSSLLKDIIRIITVIVIVIVIGLIATFVAKAWTSPTANPPGGGGALYYYNGNVGIGTTGPSNKLTVKMPVAVGASSLTTANIIANAGFRTVIKSDGSLPETGFLFGDSSGVTNNFWIQVGKELSAGVLNPNYDLLINPLGGNVGIGMTTGQKLDVAGNVRADGFLYSSDRSLKTDISKIENVLDKILTLEGVNFKWKDSGKKSIGFIAQDVEKVFPELVTTDKNTGLKSLEYGNLTGALVEAIKEQQTEIKNQQTEIDLLKQEIEKLKN